MRYADLIKALIPALGLASLAQADSGMGNLFPSSDSNSALYYQLGGGNSVPMPAVSDRVSLPIEVQGNGGVGFSCGKFDPSTSIANSLNDAADSVQNVSQNIMSNATSAIISFPMYKLAQADPKLYNILNNNVIGAHNQYSLNMKSCEQMQTQALKGQDPYEDWMDVSRNDNMKSLMSMGDGGAVMQPDLNQALKTVNQDQGKNGVTWPHPGSTPGASAGGQNQPPIQVIHDTVIAGYNVDLGRNPTDLSTPTLNSSNQNLIHYWPTPESSAQWVVNIVGDKKVSTCEGVGCEKDSTPGRGLLSEVQSETERITQSLSNLIQNPDQVTEENLESVSAPGQMVSPDLLQDIRQMDVNAQANTIATLGQDMATTRVINEALLAIDLLQMGSEVPSIQAVGPAQSEIKAKRERLQADIDHIMYSVNIRRQLNSSVMENIVRYNQTQNAAAANLPPVLSPVIPMTHGALIPNPPGEPT